MATVALANVQFGPHKTEMVEIPLPLIRDGAGLLRVEANGLCASDIDALAADPDAGAVGLMPLPRINGHEIVGTIEELSPGPLSRAGFSPGDRVAINPLLSCGHCADCLSGHSTLCSGFEMNPHSYGFIPTTVQPQLWGGYSTHLYLHPMTVMYPMPVDPLDGTLFNPLSAGVEWAVLNTGGVMGSTVLILGCGQRGLSCVVAARAAGAERIVVTGLSSDRHKLDLALELGADDVVNVEAQDIVEVGMELTGGRGFDVTIDTTPSAGRPVLDAIRVTRRGGVISIGGLKNAPIANFPSDEIVGKGLRIVGAASQSNRAYSIAARMIAKGNHPLRRMRTHVVGFDRLDYAIALLTNQVPGEKAINIVVTPTLHDPGSTSPQDQPETVEPIGAATQKGI